MLVDCIECDPYGNDNVRDCIGVGQETVLAEHDRHMAGARAREPTVRQRESWKER